MNTNNLSHDLKKMLGHLGRVMLALYFLIPGIGKFTAWEANVALMEAHNMVMIPFLLAIAAVAQVVGSISMLLNKYVAVCALGFSAMTILININLHDFWNVYEGVDVKHEYQNFFKNLGIFAGLLLLAAANLDQAKKQP